jgi:hypothetical protein
VAADYIAVVRGDTGQVLGIHGKDYQLGGNREVFEPFDQALHASQLGTGRVLVCDALSHDGARAIRTYRFPMNRLDVGLGDLVEMELKVVNSYDASAAFTAIVGGHRLACENGMTVSRHYAHSYGRHTRGFDISAMIQRINGTFAIFLAETRRWRRWRRIVITDADADRVFATLPGVSVRLQDQLMQGWHRERAELGRTLWALFNTATHWASHGEVRRRSSGNRPSIILEREARVRTLINGAEFQRLAA